ncbi:Hypothetical predicted protein [Mytilus galloprovincialis]|uniref:Uncharacterized protein n=1 Tax=Mytilus galloprovincialis TaxID=29158 RepID=A0A8B6F7X6_MYTGA|nr:Hypothetical predicted protein [Mytilus galloprovincialis]
MGITVKSTWRLDMIRQLYFVNQKDVASSTESGQNGSMESSIRNIDEVTVAADDQPNVDTDQPVNENNTMSRTADMLKDSTSALKSANEAMSAMSSMVVGLLANKDASSNSTPCEQRAWITGVIKLMGRCIVHVFLCQLKMESGKRRFVDTSDEEIEQKRLTMSADKQKAICSSHYFQGV